MIIKKLFFPGKFDEAYIYMQKLLLLDEEGSVFFIDLDRVARHLEDRYSWNLSSAPTHLFSRNDWLNDTRIKLMMGVSPIQSKFVELLRAFPDEIELGGSHIEHAFDGRIGSPLDVAVYYRRLYIGTDEGFFHADLQFGRNEVEAYEGVEQRHDALCAKVNAKFGSVTISCGDDGMFTWFDEFDRLGERDRWLRQGIRVQEQSLRTAWLFGNLINYVSFEEPVLLGVERSKKQMKDKTQGSQEQLAVRFKGEPKSLSSLLFQQDPNQQASGEQLLFLYNIADKFYAQTRNRQLISIKVKKSSENDDELESSEPALVSQRVLTRVLDVVPVRQHLVFELYDKIQLLENSQLITLVEGEALSVKSFPGSRRFQNLLTVVTEDGVHLVSLFDEQRLLNI